MSDLNVIDDIVVIAFEEVIYAFDDFLYGKLDLRYLALLQSQQHLLDEVVFYNQSLNNFLLGVLNIC